jgi:hypothetical protein
MHESGDELMLNEWSELMHEDELINGELDEGINELNVGIMNVVD